MLQVRLTERLSNIVQGHTAIKWYSWDTSLVMTQNTMLFPPLCHVALPSKMIEGLQNGIRLVVNPLKPLTK